MTATLFNSSNAPIGNAIDGYVYPQFLTGMRVPTSQDIYPPGTQIFNSATRIIYETTGAGNWFAVAGGGETLTSLTVTGPTTLTGTTNINTSGSSVTTIGTGGTGATNIGNATGGTVLTGPMSVSGLSTLTGGINTAPVVVTAGASPQTSNGRSGQVTFSGVSIAAGATQSFVINNTSISAVGTVILYSMVGATTGAALNIQSVTNVAGTSSTIVVENGTGATTSTANITFTYIVLN